MNLEIYRSNLWSGHGEYEDLVDPTLKACPFCAATQKNGAVTVGNSHTPYFSVQCEDCGAKGPTGRTAKEFTKRTTKAQALLGFKQAFLSAIELWNEARR